MTEPVCPGVVSPTDCGRAAALCRDCAARIAWLDAGMPQRGSMVPMAMYTGPSKRRMKCPNKSRAAA